MSATVWGEPLALSARLTLADLLPADTGLNVTDSGQLAFAASVDPQVFDNTKSSASTPVTLIDDSVKVPLPLLVTVTDFAAEAVPAF